MAEVKLEYREGVFLTFDTDDIESFNVNTYFGYDTGVSESGSITRTLNGENELKLDIKFKNGKRPLWKEEK